MSEFFSNSRKIATDFLQNVIIIDDEAYSSNISDPAPVKIDPISINGRRVPKLFDATAKKINSFPEASEHQLNIQMLTDTFASNGLLCSILQPKRENNDFVEKTKNLLKKADVIILDWNIKINGKSPDDTVQELIQTIIQEDESHKQKRLRYIAIYSGEDNLEDKLVIIKTLLDKFDGMNGIIIEKYKLLYDHLQISIYAKTSQKIQLDPIVVVAEDVLVNKIIDEFTQLIQGIVPNIALQSLSNIRENTHRVLTKFSNNIDDAYLIHRAMLPEPRDAEKLLVDMLTDELQSILEDCKFELNSVTLKNWLEHKFDLEVSQFDKSYSECYLNKELYKSKDEMLDAMSFCDKSKEILDDIYHGIKDSVMKFMKPNRAKLLSQLKQDIHDCILSGIGNIEKKPAHLHINGDSSKFAKILNPNSKIDGLNCFAILSTNKTFYTNPRPYLTLGTILKEGSKYYISLMPRCDAARIKETDHVNFPLFPLGSGDSKGFEIIFEDGKDSVKRQKIDYSPKKLFTAIFLQESGLQNSPLYAKEVVDGSNRKYIFKDNNGIEYEWITELKKEKAQNISNKFAAQFSRVGFNESEYLRRAYQ